MELTYKVRGADGKEYGPVTLEQLTGWVRESRIGPQSEVMRSDTDYWARVSNFEELKSALPVATTPPPLDASTNVSGAGDPGLVAQIRTGASWFYAVAGLSVVNTLLSVFGAGIRFIFGLGITQIADAVGQGIGGGGKFVALFICLMAAAVLVLFGVFANKRHTWAFAVGLVLYALDGLIMIMAQDWFGMAFHAYVVFRLVRGLIACRELNKA